VSWETVKLGQIIKLEYGKGLNEKDRFFDGAHPAFGANGIKSRTNLYLYDKPSIIVGRKGSAGELTLVREKFWALDVSYYLVHDQSKTDLRYLYFALLTKNLPKFARGVKPGINRNDIYELEIPLPPLFDQQKIVAKLDAIFAEIDKATAAAEANIKNAEALFQSYLSEVFECGGDEWSTTNFQSVVKEVITGPFGSSLHKSDYVENGVPVINPQNIINGKIIPLNKTMVSIETKDRLNKFALQKKDIVIARRGEMGRCGLVDTDSEGWLCGTGSMIIRLNDKANEKYIFQLLQSNRIKQQLESASVGATMNNLNQSILLGVQIALPPIEFQVKILNTIEQLSNKYFDISQIYFKKIKHLTALKQSILQQAFNGELIKE
jgi:type I restriction enzyme S subunit